MSKEVSLKAELRTETGKGGSRRVRRQGLIPGVVYKNNSDPISVQVEPMPFRKAVMGKWRRNALIRLEIPGHGTKAVMIKELQKHPVRRHATHVDFMEVDESVKVALKVPFTATGRSKAQILGGRLQMPRRYLNVKCLPTNIPEKIILDTTPLDWGAHRASVVPLPEGVELMDDDQLTVLTITRPRGAEAVLDDAPAAAPAADEEA